MIIRINIACMVFLFFSCSTSVKNNNDEKKSDLPAVTADIETSPVTSDEGEDAADDPAIWIHPLHGDSSRILGTNKKAGLCVYDLKGNELEFFPAGLVNNVDVRYNFRFNDGSLIDIMGASNRTNNSILIMGIDQNGSLKEIAARDFISGVDEVYGFCLFYDTLTENHYAFINGKDGNIEQWELFDNGNQKIDARIVRSLNVDTQPEGMVADDETGILYVGEEMRGIWRFEASVNKPGEKLFIENSDTSNANISYDIEGLTLYYAQEGKGYLIASSQGNYTYAIFERQGSNQYLASFIIGDGIVDAAEETDGLHVTNAALGKSFPGGMLVVQDGYNYDSEKLVNQNFKYIDWRKIAKLTDPELLTDTTFSLRKLSTP